MRYPFNNGLFLFAILLYGFLFLLKKFGLYFPVVSDYGADILTLTVVLPIVLGILKLIRPEGDDYWFSIWHVLFGVVFYAVLFEWVFPAISPRFTADLLDIIAYAVGGLLFWLFQNGNRRGIRR